MSLHGRFVVNTPSSIYHAILMSTLSLLAPQKISDAIPILAASHLHYWVFVCFEVWCVNLALFRGRLLHLRYPLVTVSAHKRGGVHEIRIISFYCEIRREGTCQAGVA